MKRGQIGSKGIYEQLKIQILDKTYSPGDRLPSSRALADELGVSRTTVTVAYEQLMAEGFISARPGARAQVMPLALPVAIRKGSDRRKQAVSFSDFAKSIVEMAEPPAKMKCPVADFRYGALAVTDFPVNPWKKALGMALGSRRETLSYDDPQGNLRLRTALQAYLWRSKAIQCSAEQILIVSGSQQGLDLCSRILLTPEDRFVIENPCYVMAMNTFAASGAKPVSIDVDAEGMQTSALPGVKARLAYVTPSHQFPLGSVMGVARRMELLQWASVNNAFVVEDDYDSEYRYDIKPVPSLYGLRDESQVIYLGTVSKTLAPFLRIGYMVIPKDLIAVFRKAKMLADRHSSLLEQEAFAEFLESGQYERHIRRIRRKNSQRRDVLVETLQRRFSDRIEIQGDNAGLHIVVWLKDLPEKMEPYFLESAQKSGVGVYSVKRLYTSKSVQKPRCVGLVMGYSALTEKQIVAGVDVLYKVVSS